MASSAQAVAAPAGWLRGRDFDLVLIAGVAATAIGFGTLVAFNPQLFALVLFLDLWILGYHHVVATYTRLFFDLESFRSHRFLIVQLPLIVLAGAVLLAYGVGIWTLASLYLYWQWFHYARQSWGVSQAYRRKAGALAVENKLVSQVVFYLMPVWGILHRSHQDPGKFLGQELKVLPVPGMAVELIGQAAVLALVWWAGMQVVAWKQGRLPLARTLFLLSHFAVFYIGYIAIDNIDAGWLVLNIWHNAQYILFVWMYNNNRFRAGVEPGAKFLSKISQTGRMWSYLWACFGISTAIYVSIAAAQIAFDLTMAAVIVVYQTINFHHYIVDGVIWKLRKKPLQKTLGLAG